MEENKRGGKREGAGRKSSNNPKETVSIYVEKTAIWKFGNKEKLKLKLYEFINDFGKEPELKNEIKYSQTTPDSYDAAKMKRVTLDEPKMWQEEKPVVNQFDAYKQDIDETTYSGDLEKLMKIIKADNLPKWQQTQLETYAKEHAKEFTN